MPLAKKSKLPNGPSGGPLTVTVKARVICGPEFRLDAKYYQDEFALARAKVRNSGFQVLQLSELASCFVPGRATLITTSNQSVGAPYLRAHDAFEVRPRSHRYVVAARTTNYESYLLRQGMLLTPSSGRNLGPLALVGQKLSQFAMTDIMRIVPRNGSVGPYLFAYLLTPTGQALIRRGRTGTTVDHLSPDEIGTIPVALPEEATVDRIAGIVNQAESTLDNAQLALDRLEVELHEKANLPLPSPEGEYWSNDGARVFDLQLTDIRGRLDAAFYDPRARACLSAISGRGRRLNEVASFRFLERYVRFYVEKPFGRPILSGRQIHQLRPVNLRHISDRSFSNPEDFVLRRGWTVFPCRGRAEEGLGSPVLVNSSRDGWMASEHVMRVIPEPHTNSGYLYLAMCSPYVQIQLKSYPTGSVVDVLDPTVVGAAVLPWLDSDDERERLGSEAVNAWENIAHAQRLEASAISELEALLSGNPGRLGVS